jgi:hypothetical protein
MDAARFSEIKRRTDRAQAIIEEIRSINRADPMSGSVDVKVWTISTGVNLLPRCLTAKIFVKGSELIISELEQELEDLLSIVPPQDELEPVG